MASHPPDIALSLPDRPDRLPVIAGPRPEALTAEWSADAGATWHPATVYPGEAVDDWRPVDAETWNRSVTEGVLPAGDRPCVWACWFDLDAPGDPVALRIRAGDRVLLQQDLTIPETGLLVNHRNVTDLAAGPLHDPWSLRVSDVPGARAPSIHGAVRIRRLDSEYPTAIVQNADHEPLTLAPGLDGWHRVYVGLEPESSVRVSFSNDATDIPVPNQADGKLKREFCVAAADLTGQRVSLRLGGARVWPDLSVRYIRFVPMTDREVAQHRDLRDRAATGRPFAGYLEQVTDGYYNGDTVSLTDFTRNEMHLHRRRGCTNVYAHVHRIGFSAWYHSKVVDQYRPAGERFEREDPAQLKWTRWMEQGDPLAVAVAEARSADLRIFADVGMNITYLATDRFHYRAMTGAFAEAHPELMCQEDLSFFDYRHGAVREYAASIIHELLNEYDLDGVHLDFARFAYNGAYDHASLVDTLARIHRSREAAVTKWGHPVAVSVRIPSYLYHHWDRYTGDFPEFLSALRVWAQNGWIDRAMVCSMLVDRLPELSLERYVEALSGTDVTLWGDLYATPPDAPARRPIDIASGWCRQGLNGGFFIYDAGRPIEFDDVNWRLRAIDSLDGASRDRSEARRQPKRF